MLDRRLPLGSDSSGKVRKYTHFRRLYDDHRIGNVFSIRGGGEGGRRKNTFIKIARDHRNALIYGRVQMTEGGGWGKVFDRMARGMSSSFLSFLSLR